MNTNFSDAAVVFSSRQSLTSKESRSVTKGFEDIEAAEYSDVESPDNFANERDLFVTRGHKRQLSKENEEHTKRKVSLQRNDLHG